ncbi:MAG TPA: SDR family NAD(P)-dependent oxidoreductase [Chloroflexota bacterium]|jgi:NAD(P)-dependent dehydrogenase (short-subunit alcohol dehydrogenase family)|nr:SDR family NAD(P)-dependent oxidoreductase [Chloroflexota bacterium]
MGRLEGKVAIITGAGPGIGRAVPTLFAREGARVTLVDVQPQAAEETAAAIRASGGEALVLRGDAASSADWRMVVERTLQQYGRLDTLVNSASWTRAVAAVDLEETDWDRSLAVTLKSVYLGAKFSIPAMRESGGGAIVNISSANGLVSNPGFAAYSAAKSGVIGLTRNLAIDYGLLGIRVNAICPGLIINEHTLSRYLADEEEARGSRDPYLVGRWGKPEDVAFAALYLASDEAAFVTGAVLAVDGGLTCQSPEATIRPSFRRRWRQDVALIRDAD